MEAMHFRRWQDIKACLKQNEFWTEKTRGVEGYDPTQNYRLVWDVMTFNMNQIIEKCGLDLTMDETTWPNSSYADKTLSIATTAVTFPVLEFSIAISLALIVSSASLVALIGRVSVDFKLMPGG